MIKSGVGKILDYILDFPQLVLKQCIFVSLACECDADGTLSGGLCVSYSNPATRSVVDQCLCKKNVQGANCDQCKHNYFVLSSPDP